MKHSSSLNPHIRFWEGLTQEAGKGSDLEAALATAAARVADTPLGPAATAVARRVAAGEDFAEAIDAYPREFGASVCSVCTESTAAWDVTARRILTRIQNGKLEPEPSHTGCKSGDIIEDAGSAPVIRMVNMILLEALRRGAKTISLVPTRRDLRLSYEVAGKAVEVPSPPLSLAAAVAARIKVMSNLDPRDTQSAQRGGFAMRALNRDCEVTVAVFPDQLGEQVRLTIEEKSQAR